MNPNCRFAARDPYLPCFVINRRTGKTRLCLKFVLPYVVGSFELDPKGGHNIVIVDIFRRGHRIQELVLLCVPIFEVNPELGESVLRQIRQHDFQLDENWGPVVEIAALDEVLLVYRAASRQTVRPEQ